ncbi:MATalpha2_B [Zygosaccharomyces parabailii]|nr:MATalpha2_B [Zygosaccharomyces parabailii]
MNKIPINLLLNPAQQDHSQEKEKQDFKTLLELCSSLPSSIEKLDQKPLELEHSLSCC